MQPAAPTVLFFLGLNKLGGAELSMAQLARNLHARGVPAEFAVYGSRRRDLMHSLAGGLTVNDLRATRTFSSIFPLMRLLRRKRPAFLVTALHHTNVAGILATRLACAGTRVIVTEHGSAHKEFVVYKSRHHRFMKPIIRLLYPRADAVVAVSHGLAEEVRSLLPPGSAVQVVCNPVIGEKTPGILPPAHAWLEPGAPKVIMGIGRLSPEKDFASLIRAFARLNSSLRLVILGEGAERRALEALAKALGVGDRVLLPGFVERIDAWLPYACVFVSSSQYEGFGNAIVEAMARRVPVVAIDCPFGPEEILDGGRLGRLVPLDAPDALAEAIAAALDDAGDLDAAQASVNRFTIKRCVDDYLALMQHIMPSAFETADNLLSVISS